MGGEREGRSADDSSRVEELILTKLDRIETKVDEGFGELRGDVTNLKVTVGKHDVMLARAEGYGARLVPWLMLGWNVLMTVVGIVWAVAHLAH